MVEKLRKFNERFDIEVGLDEGRQRFMNRVCNLIFEGFARTHIRWERYEDAQTYVAARLGDLYSSNYFVVLHRSGDFYKHLHALEAISDFLEEILGERWKSQKLWEQVQKILEMTEVDLGVTYENGRFLRKGAALLDHKLVNDPLHWLTAQGYDSVLTPYKKGLDHLLRSVQQPQLRADVITDMYEAVEALAKIVVGNGADLSRNREVFVKAVRASAEYKKLLKQYIEYANDYRHGAEQGAKRPVPSTAEAENFVYLTGTFIRLAMT